MVLSAAHCAPPHIDGVSIAPRFLPLPSSSSLPMDETTQEPAKRFGIRKRILHPHFNETSLKHDVVLLLLDGYSTAPTVRINNDSSLLPTSNDPHDESTTMDNNTARPPPPPTTMGNSSSSPTNNNNDNATTTTMTNSTVTNTTANPQNNTVVSSSSNDTINKSGSHSRSQQPYDIRFQRNNNNNNNNATATSNSSGLLLTVIGWGVTDPDDSRSVSPLLQQATVEYVDNAECVNISRTGGPGLHYDGRVTDDMMCTLDDGRGSCQGDSGGPLLLSPPGNNNDNVGDLQVGIVSWGFFCAKGKC